MTNTMAFAISPLTSSLLHNPRSKTKPSLFLLSNSTVSTPRNPISHHVTHFSHLGFAHFSQWSGLKQLGISMSRYSVKMGRKGKCKGKGVYASLFGVGAPEALVIGVVALLVFGPKGLAEVARNFGKTLRSFQPTIRELQEVSREFKSTIEREIGLDEIDNRVPRSYISNNPTPTTPVNAPEDLRTNVELDKSSDDASSPSSSGAYTADEYLKVTEAQLTGALARLQKEQEEEKEKSQNQPESQTPSQDTRQEEAVPPSPSPEPGTEI